MAIPQRTLITHKFEVTEQPFGFDYLSRGDLFMEVEGFKNFGVSAPIFMKLSKSEKVIVGSQLFSDSQSNAQVYKVRKLAR